MIWARCDQPPDPGEAKEHAIHGSDGPGATVQVHKQLCPQPPTQSYPVPWRRSTPARTRGRRWSRSGHRADGWYAAAQKVQDRYFAAGHDKTAEAAFLAIHHDGSVAQMLHAHGYRGVADRSEKSSVTKAAVDQGLWEECPKGCDYRGTRESINNHVNRYHQS